MQEGSGLGSGASLRWTDEGVRPYVIFGGPQHWSGASLRRTDEGVRTYVIFGGHHSSVAT